MPGRLPLAVVVLVRVLAAIRGTAVPRRPRTRGARLTPLWAGVLGGTVRAAHGHAAGEGGRQYRADDRTGDG
ncbi:MAG: hypothetical protein ACRDP3_26625 [Streptomyces sp.]